MISGYFLKQKKKKRIEKKDNERMITDWIIRDIRTLFGLQKEEEDYYESKRISKFWDNNYMENESNGDQNKNLSLDEYYNKVESYLRNIVKFWCLGNSVNYYN